MIEKEIFGHVPGQGDAFLYTLKNASGAVARITNYGGIVVSLEMPDRNGRMADIVLGYDSLAEYVAGSPYFGATIGRVGNRIGGGRFRLGGDIYLLAKNDNGVNCLHGGNVGFDKKLWSAIAEERDGEPGLRMSYLSRDGEEKFPGNLNVEMRYALTAANELRIEYSAKTDKATPVSLTHHSYFNLKGAGRGNIEKHLARFAADRITPVDAGLIPTGEIFPVRGTPFDFSTFREIGAKIDEADEQLRFGNGYDHNFIISGDGAALRPAAEVREPESGRTMEVLTTYPGFQFYTGNFLDGTIAGKRGMRYCRRGAFCIEPQFFPDSVNHPEFSPAILQPGEKYCQTIIYRFGIC